MSTVCMKSNASSKTWTRTPLPDRFIDDHLVELFPLFDQAQLQLVDVTNLAAVHKLLQLPPNVVVDWVKVRTVGWPQSWSDVYCLRDYVICLRSLRQQNGTSGRLSAWLHVTLYCKLKYFVVNIWILTTRVINNISYEIWQFCRTYILNQAHEIWLGCVLIWCFYRTLSRVQFFRGHSV